jgi:hypothetical protein
MIHQETSEFNPEARAGGGLDLYKEQFAANECKRARGIWLVARSASQRKAIFFHPRCKMWNCPECSKAKAYAYGFRAAYGVQCFSSTDLRCDFVTLTSHRNLTQSQALWVLPQAWDKLRKRAQRSGMCAYFAVPELGAETGHVHVHLIVISLDGLSERYWKDEAPSCGLGYINNSQEIYDDGINFYVTKYILKGVAHSWFAPGARRVRMSNWPAEKRELPGDWEIIKTGLDPERARFQELKDWLVISSSHQAAWLYIDSVLG